MFDWFGDDSDSDIFVLQEDGRYGPVHKETDAHVIGDVGRDAPENDIQKNRFLGLTIPKRRFRIGAIFLVAFVFLLIGRAAHLQIISGSYFQSLAERNRFRTYSLVPPRGNIYDRNGEVLAENTPSFTLTMVIGDLPNDEDARNDTLNRVGELVGVTRTDLDLLLSKYGQIRFQPVPVQRHIPHERAMRLALETESLAGFQLRADVGRSYIADSPSLSHVLGYLGKINAEELEQFGTDNYRPVDSVGKAGVERSAEPLLRGKSGERVVEVNARGDELSVVSKTNPVPGADITLSIDSEFQKFIETRINDVLRENGANRASVVAIDPRDGSIRALVSVPGFDNNAFAQGVDQDYYEGLLEDENNPLFPRAVAGEFPSGSTFKPFVAYAALAEGLVSAHTTFLSTGGVRIGQWFFPDWKAGGHGLTDVRKAIAESVNTYFYIIGGGRNDFTGLGVKRIKEYARKFGFGAKTKVDLPSEADGFLPSKDWKKEAKGERWYVGDTYNLSIGQGDVLVTPLQLARATGIIANGGTKITPHVIQSVDGPAVDWHAPTADEPIEGLDQTAMQIVREGMRQTVTRGSAQYLQTLTTPVAGKTGTAQTPGDKPTHAWFTGFGPWQDSNIAIAVLIEEGGGGAAVAVPLARDIFQWWFMHGED